MVELDDWRIRDQENYLSNKTFYFHQYEPRTEVDDHAHCEFCWEKFSVYDGTSHMGYSTLDDMYWVCAKCFDDFTEMFSFQMWDSTNYEKIEIQHILAHEIGNSNGLENIYRVDRVLRLLLKLHQIGKIQISGEITPVIVNISFQTRIAPQTNILSERKIDIHNGTISDFQTAIFSMRQNILIEKNVDVRYDNLFIRYIDKL